jgi:hypothetical protein
MVAEVLMLILAFLLPWGQCHSQTILVEEGEIFDDDGTTQLGPDGFRDTLYGGDCTSGRDMERVTKYAERNIGNQGESRQ